MILLDMEIPKNCWSCPMQRYAVRSDNYICVITGKFAEEIEERSAFCPIKAEIPKNATNGDVIKAMFPQAIFTDSMVEGYVCTIECHLIGRDTKTMYFNAEWWNAPWRGNDDSRTD